MLRLNIDPLKTKFQTCPINPHSILETEFIGQCSGKVWQPVPKEHKHLAWLWQPFLVSGYDSIRLGGPNGSEGGQKILVPCKLDKLLNK